MNTARVQGSAPVAAFSAVIRTINVNQNLFPGPGKTFSTTVDLGKGWVSSPVSVTVLGKTLQVTHIASRGRGEAINRYSVTIPRLPDGLHSAVVKLENGVDVKIVLSVRSTH